ncbi:hypothetical protein Lalb_Chr20g0114771 [Lupinus albus]|uniref:Uncharacterized protein n=1 Tax=Lupinus albus TaxID=3870 RepID=A0A6A4NWP6_LUPAL|nr:hypothetical protein Lalb_Chr20g0114771 [Lupinus albus]
MRKNILKKLPRKSKLHGVICHVPPFLGAIEHLSDEHLCEQVELLRCYFRFRRTR